MVGTRRDKGDAGMQLDDVTERERGAFTRHGGASRIRLRTREGITHTVYTRRSQREKILDEEELLLLLRSNHGGHQGADLIISLREGRYFLPYLSLLREPTILHPDGGPSSPIKALFPACITMALPFGGHIATLNARYGTLRRTVYLSKRN